MRKPIETYALELTLMFTDEIKIPSRFKKDKGDLIKDSKIEREFQESLAHWSQLIENILKNVDSPCSYRFIGINPRIEEDITLVTECEDFLIFTDYLIERRDIKKCDDDELGRLCMLHNQFQKKIEKKLKLRSGTKLKNENAQKLREEGTLIIDGIEVNFWQNHSFSNIEAQESWNKIKSYTELNKKTDGSSGHVVFTGVMQIPRAEIAEYALDLGFKVHGNVSKNTNYVVLGSENVSPDKVAKALELNRNNKASIQFMDENSFLEMVIQKLEI